MEEHFLFLIMPGSIFFCWTPLTDGISGIAGIQSHGDWLQNNPEKIQDFKVE